MSPFSQALYAICIEENSTTSVELIRNAAFAKLATGEVKSMVNTSLNGKSYALNISKPADVLFTEATAAISAFNRGAYKASQIDLSGL